MVSNPDRTLPPEPGPVRVFAAPQVDSLGLDNGLRLFVAQQGRLPLITAGVVLDAGGHVEPAGAEGVARLAAAALDVGTGTRSAGEIAWAIEHLGAELDVEPGWDALNVRITVPAERMESALELLAEIVLSPTFPENEVQRLRDQQLASILQRRKEPGGLATDVTPRFLYRAGSRYARPLIGTQRSVARLERAGVAAFHAQRFVPGTSALTFTGDVDTGRAQELAERFFGDWRGGKPEPKTLELAPFAEDQLILVVDRPGAVQSELRIGHIGLPRSHPDYFPVVMANTVLGGAFTSRLNLNLRERHGYTYGATSRFAFRRQAGPFLISTAVGTDVTAAAIKETLHEARRFCEAGPSAQEADAARDYLIGLLPLRLQTTAQLARSLAEVFVHDLPRDYIQTYRDQLMGVGLEDVKRVAREHIRPERFAIVVVGDAEQVVSPLCDLGIGTVEVHAPPEPED